MSNVANYKENDDDDDNNNNNKNNNNNNVTPQSALSEYYVRYCSTHNTRFEIISFLKYTI
jgi:hypothetical protein